MAFNVGSAVATIKADVTDFKRGVDSAKQELSGLSKGIKDFGNQAAIFTGLAGAAIGIFAKKSLDAYNEAEASQAKLVHAVKNVTKATNEELGATIRLADELERKGVLDGDNIKVGLAQLSTFGLSNKAVRALGGSLSDLAVNQFGVNASGEQLSDTANMMAKALNGQFGVLEKSGIRFTAAQKAIIETGTEMEKVKAINEGFAQNLKYTNEVALTTLEGKLAALNVKWGNFQEAIGGVLNAIANLALFGKDDGALFDAINNLIPDDKLAQQVTDMITMLVKGFKILGDWVMANKDLIITFLQGVAIGLAALMIIGSITMLIALMTNPLFILVAAIALLYTAWQTNFLGIRTITMALFEWLKPYIEGTWSIIVGVFQIAWAVISGIFKVGLALLKGDWGAAWEAIKSTGSLGWEGVKNIFNGALSFIKGWGGMVLDFLIKPFQEAWNKISELMNKIKGAADPNKRHSPSMVDLVKKGVVDLNKAWDNLSMPVPTINHAPQIIPQGGGTGGINTIALNINMDGAIIADDFSAQRISEKIGDAIVGKLQKNLRF